MRRLFLFILLSCLAALASAQEVIIRQIRIGEAENPNAPYRATPGDTVEKQALYAVFYDYTQIDTVEGKKNEAELTLRIGREWTGFEQASAFHTDTLLMKYGAATTEGMNVAAQKHTIEGLFHPRIFRHYGDNVFYRYQLFMPNRIFFKENTVCQWNLGEESDTLWVMGQLTHKATTTLNGVEWEAWYSTELDIDAGPWKLYGLPGLILKARTKDGVYEFTANRMEVLQGQVYKDGKATAVHIPCPINRPAKYYKEVPRNKFLKEDREYNIDPMGYMAKTGAYSSKNRTPQKKFYRPLEE